MESCCPKVLGAGSPILDLLLNVDDEFISKIGGGKGGMNLVSPEEMDSIIKLSGKSPSKAPGGSAANTIFGLSKLGINTSILGKIGDDDEGRFYVSRYVSAGGDPSRFKITSQKPTGRCLSLITPDAERTMKTDLGAAATLSPDEIVIDDFIGIDLVHVEGYMLFNRELMMKILQTARKAGCKISLDLAAYQVVEASMNILREILGSFVDIVFANQDEAIALTGEKDMNNALDMISDLCELAAIKLGANGSIIKFQNEKVRVPAIKVEKAIDTTGAGDLWASGFLYGLLTGRSLYESGHFGSILGAEVVKIIGASIPDDAWLSIKNKIITLKT